MALKWAWVAGMAGCAAVLAACGGGSSKSATPAAAVRAASPTRSAAQVPTSTPNVSTTAGAGAPIAIDRPVANALLRPPFTISGTSTAFEGTLVVQVVDSGGKPLCERVSQATAGTGTVGTWETTMSFVPPGAPTTATMRAFTRSARDGSERDDVTRAVQISNQPPQVSIVSPKCNQDVQALTVLDVSGSATAYEGKITVELRDALGQLVQQRDVNADAAGPKTASWKTSFDLASVPTGAYDVVAYAGSGSGGAPQSAFSIPIRITT